MPHQRLQEDVMDTKGSHERRYSGYVLTVLGLVSVLNYYDRNLISILVEPMKRDLQLSDGDIGLLTGIGFALMYSVLGIPMARLADRLGRAKLLSSVLAIWSVMTLLSGRAVSFTSMLLARVGVGIGEAGGLPASHALVADYFPREYRGRALSVIGICAVVGISLAFAGGGWLNDRWGWRVAFYCGGAPGLLLALTVYLTVRESPTMSTAMKNENASEEIALRTVLSALWRRRSYVHLCVGLGIAAIGSYGQFAWTPAFLMRSYHLSTSQLGASYTLATGPGMIIPTFLGGALSDWLQRRDRRWPFWILAFCFGVNVPVNLILFLVHDFPLAMAMSLLGSVIGGLWVAPSYALVQNLSGPGMRAVAAAIFMMIVTIVGLGLGPSITGVLSERLAPSFGASALAWSLCAVTLTCAVGVVFFLRAARTVDADTEEASRDGGP
jgi:predicted MFS family arabinose efflux permease